MNVVLQYAKDCVAAGHGYAARAYLSPYADLLDRYEGNLASLEDQLFRALWPELRLVSWGDGSGVPTSGTNLVLVGTDTTGQLHIRTFDALGNLDADKDETELPQAQASAISTLKQQLPGLLPPHVLTVAERVRVIAGATSLVSQTPPPDLPAEVLGDSSGLPQLHGEVRRVVEQTTGYVDPFGNPPGWVPSLSLETAVDLYQNVLQSSLQEIYFAYYLEKLWHRKSEKAEALDKLIARLSAQVKTATQALGAARTGLQRAYGDLKPLIHQVDDLARQLAKRGEELRKEADAKALAKEQKDAIAAAFKIGGAVLKALPLPEPFQTAAGAAGTVLDVTSTFIENGGDEAAFTNLKTQVDQLTDDKDLTEKLSTDLNDDLRDTNNQTVAIEGKITNHKAQQAKVEDAWTKRTTELENEKILAEKKIALQTAQAALKRGEQAAAQKALNAYEVKIAWLKAKQGESAIAKKKYELAALDAKLTKAELDANQGKVDVAALDGDLTRAKQASESAKTSLRQGAAALDREKAQLVQTKSELEAKKKDRAATIKQRVQQIKNITAGVATIGQTINKLMVSQSQLNSVYDKALSNLQATDGKFLALMGQAAYLAQKKRQVTQTITMLESTLKENEQLVTKNLEVINLLRSQKAKSGGVLDPSALAYIQALGQDAHRDLKTFLYYVVKAYEYYTVQPWDQSYLTAQPTFEALRRVLEPSEFQFDFQGVADADAKKQKLQDLLKQPENRQDGVLKPEDFELLKLVYQKPLRDMGLKLAKELMTGSLKLSDTIEPVTLGAEELRELNDRIAGCDLLLMPSLDDVAGIPTAGRYRIIVAAVKDVLHFCFFDRDGRKVVDTDEKKLTAQAGRIEELRTQLKSWWPPHELTESEKARVIAAVTAIVDHTRIAVNLPMAAPFNLLRLRQIVPSRERQRIKNIRIVRVQGQKLGPRLPDKIIFKFILAGKSIVRSGNRLYAFDPFDPKKKRDSDTVVLPKLTFETDGGKQGAAEWTDSVSGCALLLIPSVDDPGGIPDEGQSQIIVAAVKGVLHFRIFDQNRRRIADTDETKLAAMAGRIANLRDLLKDRWPPHVLTEDEKTRVIAAVTSIVGHTWVLEGNALWQTSDTPQANLLTKLMEGYTESASGTQLITISQFRPGVFSDFVLAVDFSPPESRVKFTELKLGLTLETGNANDESVFVSVNNNRDLEIPITASKKDHSGRDGGIGSYVGLYDDAKDPIRFTVPTTYGRYRHVGWLENGIRVQDGAGDRAVSRSSYITAVYEE